MCNSFYRICLDRLLGYVITSPANNSTGSRSVLNRSQDKTNGALMHSNSSVVQLLLYDVITWLANSRSNNSFCTCSRTPVQTQRLGHSFVTTRMTVSQTWFTCVVAPESSKTGQLTVSLEFEIRYLEDGNSNLYF